MDIQKKQATWNQERPLFEANFIHSHLLEYFSFNESIGDYELVEVTPDFCARDVVFEIVNTGWAMWLRAKCNAKSQAVPEGFVLLEKKNLRDTYYLVDSEHVVDDPTEYELELECGEIATLEKWQRTKEIEVFCANIYSDEDNFEVVEFESIVDAEKAIAENKVMLEAQEQSNG